MGILVNLFNRSSIQQDIEKAKSNDVFRDDFIKKYMPFIIKTISKTTGRYVQVENDRYLTISLIAFNDAINAYEIGKGKFVNYAEKIIKNRITDEMRRDISYNKKVISIEDDDNFYEMTQDTFEEKIIVNEEIKAFKSKLLEHNITLNDLLNESPKHNDTRQNCYRIASCINNDKESRDAIWFKGKFLRRRIVSIAKTTEKILKRNRKFIIASAIVIIGKYETLREYVKFEGGDTNV